MKAMSHMPGASDRVATWEELYQVMDLLDSMANVADFGESRTAEVTLSMAANEVRADAPELWLDRSEEDSKAEALDSELDSVAELFVDRHGLVN